MSKKDPGYFIDTNVFLRALIHDDEKTFADVISFLEHVKDNQFKAYTSSLVLAEVVWTLLSFYRLAKDDVLKSIDSIVSLRGLTFLADQDVLKALSLYKKHNVKYVDCLIRSSLSDKKTWVVVSYDKDFDKLDVKRLEPSECLKNHKL